MLKKGLSVLIALIICFSAVTVLPSSAATESGYDSAAIGAELNYNGFNYTVDSNSKVTITGYTGSSESITIPAKINGNVVVGIGTGAFRGKTTITEVKIEAALTSMGTYAFGYCSGLKSVTINSGTTVLGYYAFGECSSLERVTLPGTLTKIGSYAFYKCAKLTQNITIPDSVTEIGNYAFQSSGISSVKFGSKLQKIGTSAFALCGNIVDVTLPDSVTSIGQGAFGTCGKLETVKIGNNVSEMGNYAFGYNDSLKEVYIAEGTTVIGKLAFAYTGSAYKSNLSKVTIPASVIKIGNANSENKVYKDNEVFGIGRTVTAVIHGVNGSFAQDFCNANAEACNLQWYNGGDTTKPSVSIYSENEVTSEQKVKLSMSDDFELSLYYWGLNSSTDSVSYTGISGKSKTIDTKVRSGGTYYLTVKDTSGNIAQASATFYKTTLDANGGSVSLSYVVTLSGNSFDFPIPTRSGYTFKGWATERTASSGITSLKPTGNQTYYAAWTAVPSDTTKPTASISSTNNVASSQTVTLSMSDDTALASYYWGTSSSTSPSFTSISGKSYSIDKTINSSGTYYLTVKDTNGNVYQTSVTFYKTSLDGNGGSVSPTSVLTKSGDSFTFPTPTRSGYTYNGWSTSSTATSGITSLKPTGNQTYYAVWTAVPSDTTKPTASISSTNNVASSQTVTLSMSDNTALAGYYWGTSSSTSPSYTAISGKSYSTDKTVSSSGTYYLTVKDTGGNVYQTSATFYKTSLEGNGGSVSPTSILTMEGNSFILPTPIRSGYTFNGWSTSLTATSGITSLKPTGNYTYYAVWTAVPSDTTKPTASISSTNNVASSQTVTLTMSDNTALAGYYWGTSSSTSPSYTSISGKSYSIDKTINSSGTYYLTVKDTNGNVYQTSATFYKTSLDGNGGSVSPTSVLTKSGNSFTFPTPFRLSVGSNGPDYMGWATDRSASSGIYTLKPSSDQTYYAIWSDNSSDTTSPTASISSTNYVSSSQTVTLTMSDNVGLDGYYFKNIRSGVLPEYKKISGKNYSTTVTIYSSATYELKVYDTNGNSYNTAVTFCNTTLDANGGSVSPASVLTKYGNSFTMPTPTRPGYTFNGWSADPSATFGSYSLTPTLDQTYYAVWKSGSDYSLTLNPESVTMYVDESVTVNVKFSGDGIKYLGFEDGDGNICSAKWGSVDWSKGTGSFVLTGKNPGKKSFVVQLIDSSNNVLYSESVFVTVIPKVDTQQSFVLTSTNDVASIQEVALEINEIKDIKGYYWGTNANYAMNKFVSVEFVDLGGDLHGYTDRWQNVDAPGTYYATLNFGKTISKTVSITFYKTTLNANGGSVNPAYVLTKAGNSFNFPTSARSGYSYKGWSTSSSATSGVYNLTPTGNQVFYAVWGYDHSISFSPEDVTVYEGESITVTVKFTGDDVKKLRYVNGDDSICSASWGKVDWGTKTVPITFYGISPGTVTFDIQLLNSSEEEIYSKNISVKILPKPSDALIKVLDAKGMAGKTVDVPITISDNPGVIGVTLSVSYDNSALELVGVKDAGILGNNSHKPEYTSPYTLSWANDTSVTNYTANGTIATLTFRIKDGVSAGKYDVRVSYDYDNYDIFDKDLNKVRFGVENGSVEVVNYIFGDVNSDGTVNNLDRVYLTRYLADWNDYQDIDLKAADVDCNGIVNNLDRVILTRYLANWADCSELPYRG